MTGQDAAFRRKQGVVAGSGLLAMLVAATVGYGAPERFADLVPAADDLATRLAFVLYPTARAFGMVMTALPSIAAYGWLLPHCRAR